MSSAPVAELRTALTQWASWCVYLTVFVTKQPSMGSTFSSPTPRNDDRALGSSPWTLSMASRPKSPIAGALANADTSLLSQKWHGANLTVSGVRRYHEPHRESVTYSTSEEALFGEPIRVDFEATSRSISEDSVTNNRWYSRLKQPTNAWL